MCVRVVRLREKIRHALQTFTKSMIDGNVSLPHADKVAMHARALHVDVERGVSVCTE